MFTSSRRGFLQGVGSAALLGTMGGFADVVKGQKIRLAVCGVMGKGFSDWMPMVKSGLATVVAFCDPDRTTIGTVAGTIADMKKKGKLPADFSLDPTKVPFFTDYRDMFDKMGAQFDAVTVSTPDHMHAAIAVRAMKMGKHVYVQKPLVRTLWEAQEFFKAAKANRVVTQMGNQGSAGDGFGGWRRASSSARNCCRRSFSSSVMGIVYQMMRQSASQRKIRFCQFEN